MVGFGQKTSAVAASSVGEIIASPINDAESLPIFKFYKVKNVKGKTNLPVEIKCGGWSSRMGRTTGGRFGCRR